MSKHYVALDTPTIHHSRSRFDLSYDVKTSGNVGTLYPFYLQEIYPGDTFNCDSTFVTRLSSAFLKPVMDNLFLDVYYFFVPARLVFDRWEEIFGENKQSAWVQPAAVEAPHVGTNFIQTVYPGSVGDYLGLPLTDSAGGKCLPSGLNVMPFRAFAKIYDDWFRDQNLQQPMLIQTGDWNAGEALNDQDWSPSNYMGKPPRVSKFHDIFTSALPSTQKSNNPVRVPLKEPFARIVADPLEGMYKFNKAPGFMISTYNSGNVRNLRLNEYGVVGSASSAGATSANLGDDAEWNLYADLADAGQINVTDLRYAFQLQRILERAARTGTRYTEYLMGAFGVSSPDARLQRSEYLGGKRMPLSVQQVAQTTPGSSAGEPLANLAAFSLSNGRCGYQKGFVEHGFVIGVFVIRQHHTYQQGIERFWQRKARFDYYDPILANISEVPVYASELFGPVSKVAPIDDITRDVFGYQEAWYDLRKRMSVVTGAMRTEAPASFDIYHFADYYANAPTLNFQFTQERPDYVDRTIPVSSSEADQFLFDIFNKQSAIRVLPTYSIPGLIDHH